MPLGSRAGVAVAGRRLEYGCCEACMKRLEDARGSQSRDMQCSQDAFAFTPGNVPAVHARRRLKLPSVAGADRPQFPAMASLKLS